MKIVNDVFSETKRLFVFISFRSSSTYIRSYITNRFLNKPRSNKHGRKRPYMEKKTVVYGRSIRRSYTISVLLHIPAYMIVFLRIHHGDILSVIRAHVKRQNTIFYGRIRKRTQSFTGVYGVRNRRPGKI
jgi:hypothetical protein